MSKVGLCPASWFSLCYSSLTVHRKFHCQYPLPPFYVGNDPEAGEGEGDLVEVSHKLLKWEWFVIGSSFRRHSSIHQQP